MEEKQSKLQSSEYKLLLSNFREWLELLGYSVLSIPGLTGSVKSFLEYQELNNKPTLEQLSATDAGDYTELLQTQTGERTKRPLSNAHINKQVQALKLLSTYLRQTQKSDIGFNIERLEETRSKPTWLTKQEIAQLYDAVPDTLLGLRDKAMLAVFYGCGLRLNEGACLELKDIDSSKKLIHVRKGKRYKERYVPVAEKNYEELKLYTDYARPQLLSEVKTEALFIRAQNGYPLDRQGLYVRIKQLARKAKIKKKVGTHTLRHSIATHLLQSGMKLERIQQFLGHSNLDSTQVYTHLVNEA